MTIKTILNKPADMLTPNDKNILYSYALQKMLENNIPPIEKRNSK